MLMLPFTAADTDVTVMAHLSKCLCWCRLEITIPVGWALNTNN